MCLALLLPFTLGAPSATGASLLDLWFWHPHDLFGNSIGLVLILVPWPVDRQFRLDRCSSWRIYGDPTEIVSEASRRGDGQFTGFFTKGL